MNRMLACASLAILFSEGLFAQTSPPIVTTYPNLPEVYNSPDDDSIRSAERERYESPTAIIPPEPSTRVLRIGRNLEMVAEGSGVASSAPLFADWGTAVSIFKKCYNSHQFYSPTTSCTGVSGEINAIVGVVRQDIGDSNVFQADGQIVDHNATSVTTDGFLSLFEGASSSILPGSAVEQHKINVQYGVINTRLRTGSANAAPDMTGFYAKKVTGVGGTGLVIGSATGSPWDYGIVVARDGNVQLRQDSSDASLTVTGPINVGAALNVAGPVNAGMALSVAGPLTASSSLGVTGQINGASNLYVAGTITAGGGLSGPAWTDMPSLVVTATSGTITNKSASGRFGIVGKTASINIKVHIDTNGTGSGAVVVTLPTAAASVNTAFVLTGRENHNAGKMLQGLLQGTSLTIRNYDNTYPGGNLADLYISGSYEIP